ncbi:sensor histidine kinase [Chitinilyticum piscinae]|uniref:histidine kinase n=1 Tax=Chitinilyticum piscinae TaxID=2866724 RepID=A0A8J7KEJ9_9NEIS|nr:sensor histidine kinase [Chitinilyticum piscinae]MBE9609609.1 sensor histidine kinase [Chitinilyticum piscinae]
MQTSKRTLKQQLLKWLLLPQLVFWLVGAALSYGVALHYANTIIDGNLQQIGRALSLLISTTPAGVNVALPPEAARLLDSSQQGSIHYTIRDPAGNVVSSNTLLPLPGKTELSKLTAEPELYNAQLGESALRIAILRLSPANGPYPWLIFQTAQKADYRNNLSHQIILSIALPLALLMLATSILVWWGLGTGLRPLAKLRNLVANRKPQDMSPIVMPDAPDEVIQIADSLNELLSTTEASIARQRRFIADAAHQLRTPLAGLKSQTELAMRETSPEQLRDRLRMVHTSATRSIHLVNQLLTLARSEPGSQTGIPKVQMDLARMLRDITAESVPRALAAGVDLGCEIFVSEAVTEGNSALLRELFINLVDNAIKYIPRNGCITVRLLEDATHYRISVEDDGPGIPDEDKVRVFERFYRREQTGNGCGLGMAIVREIAERHGGTVELRDADPHGLIVLVSLPHHKPVQPPGED